MTALVGLLGPLGIVVMLVVLALLSRRMGRVTRVAPYYAGFLVSAALVAAGLVGRALDLARSAAPDPALADTGALLVYTGLPALGVTVGVITAWRYWSWLLAERS